jgi:hypothetical protein
MTNLELVMAASALVMNDPSRRRVLVEEPCQHWKSTPMVYPESG